MQRLSAREPITKIIMMCLSKPGFQKGLLPLSAVDCKVNGFPVSATLLLKSMGKGGSW